MEFINVKEGRSESMGREPYISDKKQLLENQAEAIRERRWDEVKELITILSVVGDHIESEMNDITKELDRITNLVMAKNMPHDSKFPEEAQRLRKRIEDIKKRIHEYQAEGQRTKDVLWQCELEAEENDS